MRYKFNSAAKSKISSINVYIFDHDEGCRKQLSVPVNGIVGFRDVGTGYTAVHLHYYNNASASVVKTTGLIDISAVHLNDMLRKDPKGDRFIKLTDSKTGQKVYLPIIDLNDYKSVGSSTFILHPHSSSEVPEHVRESKETIRMSIKAELAAYPVASDEKADESSASMGLERSISRSHSSHAIAEDEEAIRKKQEEEKKKRELEEEEVRLTAQRNNQLMQIILQLQLEERQRIENLFRSRDHGHDRGLSR